MLHVLRTKPNKAPVGPPTRGVAPPRAPPGASTRAPLPEPRRCRLLAAAHPIPAARAIPARRPRHLSPPVPHAREPSARSFPSSPPARLAPRLSLLSAGKTPEPNPNGSARARLPNLPPLPRSDGCAWCSPAALLATTRSGVVVPPPPESPPRVPSIIPSACVLVCAWLGDSEDLDWDPRVAASPRELRCARGTDFGGRIGAAQIWRRMRRRRRRGSGSDAVLLRRRRAT